MGRRGRKGITFQELRWPMEKPEFAELAREWPPTLTTRALKFVWLGYDLLQKDILRPIDCRKVNKQIEKSLSQPLQLRINRVMTGDEPFDVQHEVPEFEMSYSDQAQPPSYDIAFILRANERIILPLEAKVLRTEKAVSKYVNEINLNFLTCRYAPFSSEAGMLGYLLKGNSRQAFDNISQRTPCHLCDHPDFLEREHKTSAHRRTVPMGKPFPGDFLCHHLILEIPGKSS